MSSADNLSAPSLICTVTRVMTRHRRGKRGRASPNPPAKRRRGVPELESGELGPAPALEAAAPSTPSSVMVAGLPPGCGVMVLKSRLEAYGPISRTRVDAAAATGYATFRSGAAATAAIAASLDPRGGVTIGSKKVLVLQTGEAPNNSKSVLRADPAEATLLDMTKKNQSDASATLNSKAAPEATSKREMVAYDDLF